MTWILSCSHAELSHIFCSENKIRSGFYLPFRTLAKSIIFVNQFATFDIVISSIILNESIALVQKVNKVMENSTVGKLTSCANLRYDGKQKILLTK